MNEEICLDLMENLRKGSLDKVEVSKEDFMLFRGLLLKQPDFKRFRGNAQRGGSVIYTYLEKERS